MVNGQNVHLPPNHNAQILVGGHFDHVIAALGEIMRQNTAFYQSDFDIDKGIIQRAAASDQAVDKTLLWMSRPSGTYCFRERDVFLKGTRQHNTWRFYGEQTATRYWPTPWS